MVMQLHQTGEGNNQHIYSLSYYLMMLLVIASTPEQLTVSRLVEELA
jgi:hypothetical protein